MGHRANYAIRRHETYDLYYSNWGALTVPRDLFWGPDYAEAFIRENASVGDDAWLDDVCGEGGAVLDRDRRTLVLFGGEILAHPPYRTVFLELIRALWRRWDWTVEWADWGMPDLAEQVGHDPMALTSGPTGDQSPPSPDELGTRYQQRDRINSLVSVIEANEVSDRVTGYPANTLLMIGPDLVSSLEQLPTLEHVRQTYDPPDHVDTRAEGLRRSLYHHLVIDRRRQQIDYRGNVRLGELTSIRERWEQRGWSLEYHLEDLDQMEAHFECTGREVPSYLETNWDRPSRDDVLDQVAECLFDDWEIDPAEHVRRTVERLENERDDVNIDPRALESPVDGRPDEATCRERFGWALAGVTIPSI